MTTNWRTTVAASLLAVLIPVVAAAIDVAEPAPGSSGADTGVEAEHALASALAANDEALGQARRAGDGRRQAELLEQRADILLSADRISEAEAVLKEGLAIARRLDDDWLQLKFLSTLSNTAFSRGAYSDEAARAEEALAVARKLHQPMAEALVELHLSIAYIPTSIAASEAALQEAQAIAQRNGFQLPPQTLRIFATIRDVYAGKTDVDEAREALKQYHALSELQLDGVGVVQIPPDITPDWQSQLSRGDEAFERGDLPAARDAYTKALDESRALDNKDQIALTSWSLGAAYLKEGQTDKAMEYFQLALGSLEAAASEIKGDEALTAFLDMYRNHLYDLPLELLLRQGKTAEAFELTERARGRALLQLLGNRRLRLKSRDLKGIAAEVDASRQALAAIDRQLVAAPAARRGELMEKLRQERTRYQALLVHAKLSDPAYGSLLTVEPVKVAAVQRTLNANTTLVSYFVTEAQVHAWVIDQSHCEHVALPVDDEELRTAAVCFAGTLGKGARGVEPIGGCRPAAAERLYSQLIAPLVPHFRHQRLVIVPHAELHYVPFAALRNPKTGRYLIQDFTLAYAPSASTLRLLHAKERPVAGRALVLGAPAVSDRQLQPLPAMVDEANTVARMFGTTPLLGAAARASRLFELAGKIDLLHIAAHAVFDPTAPLFSRIVLAADDRRNGNLGVHEIFSDLDLTGVSLVVLSACETALGEHSGGDEIIGLTRAFLYAGTPAVVSTLWRVNDRESAELMAEFYRHLLGGAPAAEALQQAQIALLNRPGSSDPYYWAGFTLTGDPQQRWKVTHRAVH